jgi:two-component sensor histidine kinase
LFYRLCHIIIFWWLLGSFDELTAQEVVYKNTLLYSQKQGLSSPNIYKIIMDEYGFLWIATQDGLNRFDGTQFVHYNQDQKKNHQLFSSDIRDMILDKRSGLLWVICNQGGINTIDLATGNSGTSYPYPKSTPGDQWKICAEVYDKKIFIGTSSGLEVFDMLNGQFITSKFLSQNNKNAQNAFSSDIRTISINKKGIMAFGLFNKGLFFYDANKLDGFLLDKKSIQKTEDKHFWPLCGKFIDDSIFYCGVQNGLYTIDYKKQQAIKSKNSLLTDQLGSVSAILLTNNGEDIVFAGDQLAGVHLQNNKEYFIHSNFYESESWVKNSTSIFQDDNKNIWVGSRQGLCLLKNNDPVFRATKNNTDLYNNKLGHVYSIGVVDSNTVLAGTKDGVFSIDRNSSLKQLFSGGLVQNIVRINKDVFIVSGFNGSRLWVNGKMESLSSIYPELQPYQSWQFNSYVKFNDSLSLLGTESNNGVLEWNTRTSTISLLHSKGEKNKQLPSDIINSIFLTRNRKPIILSDYIFTIYDPEKKQVFKIKGGKAEGIYMQMEETEKNYWIAAYGTGLIKTDHDFNVQKVFGTADGLSNAGLYSIFNYHDSLLFLTSNFGISVFDIKSETFSRYFEEDGLQNNTFEEASRDTFNRAFYAGGANGFVMIAPTKLIPVTNPPKLYFTRVLAEGSSKIFIDSSNINANFFSIPSQSVQVKIFFSGIHYQNPERVTYSYKIKELDNYWIDLNTQNFITLTGLSPGKYNLQVKSFNEYGVPSEIKYLTLILLPKWYQTWLFRILIVLIVFAFIYGLYRMRINQLKKEEKIRNQVASDLHDELGSTLNSIKVYSNLAQMEKENNFSHLEKVKEATQSAISGVKDIIWVLDDKRDSLDHLLTRIRTFANPLCEAAKISFQQHVDDNLTDHKLGKEEKRNLYMIIKESINNSVKYADCSMIQLEIKNTPGKLTISLSDNGKGFDKENVTSGYGLKNILYRSGEINYEATITSSPGNGTTILLKKK